MLFTLFWPTLACAKPLVADLSAYRIHISSDFRGTRLFLFGARGDAGGQVVVVVRGPKANFTVRKKARVLGMWLVRDQVTFREVPQYYALYSTTPLDFITTPELRRALRLGLGALPMQAIHTQAMPEAAMEEFRRKLRENQSAQMLYSEQTTPVRFIGDTLFKADILFPDTILPGDYIVDVYLMDGTGVAASQSVPIKVEKRGLEAFLSRAAHEHPLIYGLCAVLIAALSGWGAHRLFRRI